MKRKSLDEFCQKARIVHGIKYDYSKVDYINDKTKICIICPKHGEFWQKPNNHLMGQGCPQCGGTKKKTLQQFIEQAKQIHGNKYNYEKTEYINDNTKISIICPIHGEFFQRASAHLSGQGCPLCGKIKLVLSKTTKAANSFKDKAKSVHGEKYDYSKFEYVNAKTRGIIICPIHGEFWQTPDKHVHGSGCRKCSKNEPLTTIDFKERAIKTHGNKYDYSKVNYVNYNTKVCIICPIHGEFFQIPQKHIKEKHGCPICQSSHLEKEIEKILKKNQIKFEPQKKFKWLGRQSLDFYLPQYNIAIECQGEQHFISSEYFGGEEMFQKQQERDKRKLNLCQENNIKIIYFSETKLTNQFPFFLGQKVIGNKETLLENIVEKKYL